MTKDLNKPTFFPTPAKFRAWLKKHHQSEPELYVGFYKKATGKQSITWPESVDEALCVGWIDGIRRRIDDEAYSIRFTPRRTKSTWSDVNIQRVADLTKEGRMLPAGLEAFERREAERSRTYAYEQTKLKKSPEFSPAYAKKFREDKKAWEFFLAQPPSHRKKWVWWVESAKKPETKERRLRKVMEAAAKGERFS